MSIRFVIFFIAISHLTCAQAPKNPSKGAVRQIFPSSRLKKNHAFTFSQHFEEKSIRLSDGVLLDALLFHADSSRGLIFYLHGNTGALDKWGKRAPIFLALHYDVFMLDYRGYGKSEGTIQNEAQLYSDIGTTYDTVKASYSESNIYVVGYSIGTGIAAELAAVNHPKGLILEAPYYSLADAVHYLYPKFDTAGVPFHFNTYQYLPQVTCPVIIFHGDADKTFYYGSSIKLSRLFKSSDRLITLKGADHADIEENKDFQKALKTILQ